MNHKGFMMMEALLATFATVLLVSAAGAYAMAVFAEYGEAHQWSVARNLAVQAREQRVASGEAVEKVVQQSGVQYRVSWEDLGEWQGVPVARLKVSWHGMRGDREMSFIEPVGKELIPP